jgi:hypothetical protein
LRKTNNLGGPENGENRKRTKTFLTKTLNLGKNKKNRHTLMDQRNNGKKLAKKPSNKQQKERGGTSRERRETNLLG